MADGAGVIRGSGGGADRGAPETSELEGLRPFLELAREIKREVERIVADDTADIEQITDVIEQLSRAERRRVVLAVFERLPADTQWEILKQVLDEGEIRSHLEDEHRRRHHQTERSDRYRALVSEARSSRTLDTRELIEGDEITVGLFREPDVRSATTRGHASDACARTIVLRCVRPGDLRVIEDVFNPRGSYFVTRDYDAASWALDRFASHDMVRIGAVVDGADGPALDPVVHLGARADFEHDGVVSRCVLHVGFVLLGDIDVFAGRN